MSRTNQFNSVGISMRSAMAWQKIALDYQKMWLAASEVVWRRSLQMMMGTMTPAEAMRMVMEKPTAYTEAAERAMIANARRRGNAAITSSALTPISNRAKANAKRLRRKKL